MGLPSITLTVKAKDAARHYAVPFSVCGTVVRLRAEDDLLPALDAYLTDPRRRLFPHRAPYQRVKALRDRLADAVRVGADDLSFITDDDLHEVESFIIEGGRFQSVHCAVCGRNYRPDELDVRNWTEEHPDAAWGGKRWLCPDAHTVLARTTWIGQ